MILKLEHSADPAPEERAIILGLLASFNVDRAGPGGGAPLCLLLRDDRGAIAGGLWGSTLYGWLEVELLFVPEAARGTGMGAQLLARAEGMALAGGCIGAWLYTFKFQARGFYEKQGYEMFGAIEDNPPGGARYFLRKRFG